MMSVVTMEETMIKLLSCAALLVAAAFPLTHANATDASCPSLLLETDFDGAIVRGSKVAVVAASERGEALRVGWKIDFDGDRKADLSHWSDGKFISVWEGEVFTQVASIHRQRPVIGQADVLLTEDFALWHGLLGTNGMLKGRLEDSDSPGSRRVQTFWCGAALRWTMVYKSGLNGEVLSGSKDKLLAAIREGIPVRVGWGLDRSVDGEANSVEHVAEPVFVTIVDGTEIVAQLPEHVAQRSYWDASQAQFDEGAVMWRGLVSSTGSFDAIWVNRSTGEVIRRAPQRAVLNWYLAHGPLQTFEQLAIADGVTRDPARAGDGVSRK